MRVTPSAIPDVLVLEPPVHRDARGFFMETWHTAKFRAAGLDLMFVQDNHSRSVQGTLRGLHYQVQHAQGKLVHVVSGAVFDVAVDLRRSSPTFGRWAGTVLSADNLRQLWIPPGFAHGFYVTAHHADVIYKCTDLYAPEHERTVRWNDPAIGVNWPLAGGAPLLSDKDASAPALADAPTFA